MLSVKKKSIMMCRTLVLVLFSTIFCSSTVAYFQSLKSNPRGAGLVIEAPLSESASSHGFVQKITVRGPPRRVIAHSLQPRDHFSQTTHGPGLNSNDEILGKRFLRDPD